MLNKQSEEGFSDEMVQDTLLQTSSENLPSLNDDPNDTDYENNWGSAGINDPNELGPGAIAEDYTSYKTSGNSNNFDHPDYNIDETASADKTLRQHLYEQLGVDFIGIQERLIGAHLIEMIDDTGYLLTDPSDLMANLDCTEEQIRQCFMQTAALRSTRCIRQKFIRMPCPATTRQRPTRSCNADAY